MKRRGASDWATSASTSMPYSGSVGSTSQIRRLERGNQRGRVTCRADDEGHRTVRELSKGDEHFRARIGIQPVVPKASDDAHDLHRPPSSLPVDRDALIDWAGPWPEAIRHQVVDDRDWRRLARDRRR